MTDKSSSDLINASLVEQLDSNNNLASSNSNNIDSSAPTATVPEEMRCQYSSKRCENERTHKKSGGLHKFCAMHREKANRNQMRLDHRRRVLKQQQKELQRQQQAHQVQQMQRSHSISPVAMAAGQNFRYCSRTHRSSVGGMRCSSGIEPMSPPNMSISMSLPTQTYPTMEMQPQQPTPNLPLFDQHDLNILEAMLFSSDEEPNDATPVAHCSTPQFFRSPSFVNV